MMEEMTASAPSATPLATPAMGRMKIGIVAGEASGDTLGAGLMAELNRRHPDIEWVGIGGPKMQAAGLDAWHDAEELAVFGLIEVLKHLPRLLKLRKTLVKRLLASNIDAFIGIDAPDFNLGVEKRLKARGITTMHYVCPSVWAWRQKRVKKIKAAADHVLCLLPFEVDFLAKHDVPATFVGHPLCHAIGEPPSKAQARRALGLPIDGTVIAVLPGSRQSELKFLGDDFVGTMQRLQQQHPDAHFVTPAANARVEQQFGAMIEAKGIRQAHVVPGNMRDTVASSDVALVASGTAALEVALYRRPMVVAYRVARFTHFLLVKCGMMKISRYSLPNILGQHLKMGDIVPEITQDEVTVDNLSRAVECLLDPNVAEQMTSKLTSVGLVLAVKSNEISADAVESTVGSLAVRGDA